MLEGIKINWSLTDLGLMRFYTIEKYLILFA